MELAINKKITDNNSAGKLIVKLINVSNLIKLQWVFQLQIQITWQPSHTRYYAQSRRFLTLMRRWRYPVLGFGYTRFQARQLFTTNPLWWCIIYWMLARHCFALMLVLFVFKLSGIGTFAADHSIYLTFLLLIFYFLQYFEKR